MVQVTPVTASRHQILMSVPPYIEQHTNEDTIALVKELLRLTREIRVLLGQFYLYVAMTRSPRLAQGLNETAAAAGARIVIGSLMRTMTISLAAIFDEDPRTSNCRRSSGWALSPAHSKFFRKFHAHYGVSTQAETSYARLVKYQRQLKAGPIRQAIQRLMNIRKSYIAHFDADPAVLSAADRAIVRDIDRVIAVAAIIVGEANFLIAGRSIDRTDLRTILRHDAEGFCNALLGSRPA
jgi:hypothetical protein